MYMDSFVLPHNNTYTISKYFESFLTNIDINIKFTLPIPIFIQNLSKYHYKLPNGGGDDNVEVHSLLG